ncbi:cytochrome C oxidase subunit IV family protein [Herpetosiphon llansteffanensis]|uniref:cytochrome C oxidase subunit IV family protein n=1 Tax=Herpetosiphon llansteffanensis TaxID=2094568 RepID=UPI000D7D140C|nr:cytochrome C oxidase subunit IV family protein [Herpetosiphon llansteffanensis]
MAHGHDEHASIEHEAHHSHAKLYVIIFFILLVMTGVEIAIPIINKAEIVVKQVEVALLLGLMTIKGAIVMMFYMHLKGDRRMFGTLFVFPIVCVLLMMLGFFALFQPELW